MKDRDYVPVEHRMKYSTSTHLHYMCLDSNLLGINNLTDDNNNNATCGQMQSTLSNKRTIWRFKMKFVVFHSKSVIGWTNGLMNQASFQFTKLHTHTQLLTIHHLQNRTYNIVHLYTVSMVNILSFLVGFYFFNKIIKWPYISIHCIYIEKST